MRPASSISTCCSMAGAGSRAALWSCRIRACTSALSCCALSSTSRRAPRSPGAGRRGVGCMPRAASASRARAAIFGAKLRGPDLPMELAKCRYLVVEGPIGAGKTSLARALARHLDADALLEAPQDNPFLARFYADMQRYALPTQLNFLFQRVD